MNTASRGIRNAFRNKIRTFSIVIILGISIGLALAMVVARASVDQKISEVKSSIGNTVSISPAGVQGFAGGGEPLTNDQIAKVEKLSNVTSVTKLLNDRLTTENTNLQSAIEAGSLGRRGASNSGVEFQGPPPQTMTSQVSGGGTNNQQATRTFTPPVMVIGTNNVSSTASFSGAQASVTSGSSIDAAGDQDIAMVGKSLAEKNNLSVGSTFTAYGKTITVKAIFDAGNTFANNTVVMPISALQRLSSQAGSVTAATVSVKSIDSIDSVTADIKSTLGSAADVTNNQETAKTAVEPLESVKAISTYSLLGAVIAGAIIILLTMIMIVRERRREIGVFKAIGASNIKIMGQFIAEAMTLTLLGMVAGIVIGIAAASPVTKVLVNNSSTASVQTGDTQRTGGGPGLRAFGNNATANARNVQASVGLDIVAYGLGAAFVIAAIGSALPSLMISKIRPAEVMRAE